MAVNIWWLLTVVMVAISSASAIERTWEVEYKKWWPDCKQSIVMAINGKFPGPTIEAVVGETIIVHVKNKLSTEGVVIHWHGMRQTGTPWADGAAGVTQCPINPGETFTFKYDGEFSLLLSDWWHQSVHAQELALSSKPETLRVEPNKVYRLRIASTTALASLNLAVQGHELEVVEADGNYVEPFKVNDTDIYSGETYSVLLRTNQKSGKYWITVGVRGRKPNTTQALTILNYVDATEERPVNPPPVTPMWNDTERSIQFSKKIFAAKDLNNSPPEKSNQQLILLNTQNLNIRELRYQETAEESKHQGG